MVLRLTEFEKLKVTKNGLQCNYAFKQRKDDLSDVYNSNWKSVASL